MLTHPSKKITQKKTQAMEIGTTGQYGPCEAHLQAKTKRQTMQRIYGSDKTGSNGVGDEDLGVKRDED